MSGHDLVELTDTIEIAAPAATVWALLVDVEALPRVTPTVQRAERLDDGELRVGSTVRLKQPNAPAAVWTVTVLDAPTRFVWTTRLLGVATEAVHELAELGEGRSRQTLRVRLSGRGARLLARTSGSRIARALASENAGFREAAERAVSATDADPAGEA